MKGLVALLAVLLLAEGARAVEVDCGPKGTGAILNDGCDGERRQYCTSRILPNPPGWTGEQTQKALRQLEACLAGEKPGQDKTGRKPPVSR